jgi:RNA polymerase sigma-70 factor (ECF subfamily)
VVVNVCRTDLTRRARSPRVLGFDEAAELKNTTNNATALDDALARDEQLRLVQAALLTLSLKEREAIVLRDIEGLPTTEVAQILGSSEGTVRSQISNGRLKIRRYVESHGGTRR